ncbi:hypothetical protein [Streptosporangium sp. H16]|uniref:hypothetical protein n=1 Tax=Streptosporangium sp. H16 TaxID=3444184 RepID=UPI003F7B267F
MDVDGRVLPPPDGGDRVATRVDHDGAPLALLVHDPVLLDDPELVEAACAAAALALSNERRPSGPCRSARTSRVEPSRTEQTTSP